MRKNRRKMRGLLLVVAGLLGIAMVILAIMILSPMPVVREQDARSKGTELAAGLTLERMYESELQRFVMRDGATLQGHRFVSSSSDSLVMLHGACGFDNQLNKCSGMLREATGIEIFTYDHRGHGASPGPRGDLTYIGQYASDVADVLRAVRALKPEGRIILGGHSMGGGSMSTMEYIDDDRAGEIAGTPAYMAAVPIRFRALDHHHFQPGILWGSGVGSWNSGFLARSHSQRMR